MKNLPAVGVVGCGYWGKNLIRNFSELGSLRAVCDVDADRASALAKKYDVEFCTSYTELLARKDIQAVVIAVPAAEHFVLAKKAMLAAKDVFVEKPLALNVAGRRRACRPLRRHGKSVDGRPPIALSPGDSQAEGAHPRRRARKDRVHLFVAAEFRESCARKKISFGASLRTTSRRFCICWGKSRLPWQLAAARI